MVLLATCADNRLVPIMQLGRASWSETSFSHVTETAWTKERLTRTRTVGRCRSGGFFRTQEGYPADGRILSQTRGWGG